MKNDNGKLGIEASGALDDDDGGCKTALILATVDPKDAWILNSDNLGKAFEAWRKDPGSAPISFVMALASLRPEPRIDDVERRQFVAMDGSFYPKEALEEPEENQKYWDDRVATLRPASLEFIKSGPAIFSAMNIRISEEKTRKLMWMTTIDQGTAYAIHSSLWSTQNTSRKPVDLESGLFLLQTFIHAAPAFASSVDHKKHYVPAYGDATLYGMLKKPPKAVGDVEEDHPSDGSIDDDEDDGAVE
jgi:hypothetical protein